MVWPEADERLLRRYVFELDLKNVFSRRPYEAVLRQFQRFLMAHGEDQPPTQHTLQDWLRERVQSSSLKLTIRRGQMVSRFLDWLVSQGRLSANPIAVLRMQCRRRSTAAIIRALVSNKPTEALKKLEGLPRFGSHLGPAIREHVERMQNLGFRYDERRFRRFDEFLQTRVGAASQPFDELAKEYATPASSPAGHMERLKVGRVLAKPLGRLSTGTVVLERDPMIAREALRRRSPPCILTVEEIEHLLGTALRFPSPNAPLRPLTLYTMFVLAYCAGLRMSEIVRLRVGDIRFDERSLEIRETKFFKSRRLPLSVTAMAALHRYLEARCESGFPNDTCSPLFCHRKGGYAYMTANHLLRRVMSFAGLRTGTGRTRPRIHDLRHSFVVHRMTEWYRQGIDPQAKLPYLWTYLGHRDLHSSLVYMTITQELLRRANERFRAFAGPTLRASVVDP